MCVFSGVCVAFVNPGHSSGYLSSASVFTAARNIGDDTAVTVDSALSDLRLLLKAQGSQGLTAGGTEGLAAFGCVNGGKPHRDLFVVAGFAASGFDGVAICDADDKAEKG